MDDKRRHQEQLMQMLKQVAPHGELEALDVEPVAGMESVRGDRSLDHEVEAAAEGIRNAVEGRSLTDDHSFALEAIVMPKYRPVIDIINDNFNRPPSPWTKLGTGNAKKNLLAAIPSIGRVEVPEHPRYPYAGTGFVVGKNLLMTNRHVAEIFASGLGLRNLTFRGSQTAGIDFAQEARPREPVFLTVTDIVMVHPHWDMALLRVEGLGTDHPSLKLGVTHPDDLADNDIVVIGYPAQDVRNDFNLQNQIFRGLFDVKRLQPGKLKTREQIRDSFRNLVHTVTHDASTLGGNSGSAVIDVKSGEVIGLHFAGRYLKANYAVPAYELARDRRVEDNGVNFAGSVSPTADWDAKWRAADADESIVRPTVDPVAAGMRQSPSAAAPDQNGTATWTIPLQVSVSLGTPMQNGAAASPQTRVAQPVASAIGGQEISLRIPAMYDHLEEREGYDPLFLELDDDVEIPMPELTDIGFDNSAKLEDGTAELSYHKFTIVMHRKRRLALMTAANIDWRKENREIDGHKPTRRELTEIPEGFGEQWVMDPRIPISSQLPDVFFTKDRTAFDKGHLVRRDDVCWGEDFEDIQMANGDTYHTTNCSPQVKGFNRSAGGEFNWGDLENLVQKQTKAKKAIVFSGPVFTPDDPVFTGRDNHGTVLIKIPQQYWKVIVTSGEEGPEVFGFVLEQDLGDVQFEMAVPVEWEPHTASVEEIEELLGGLISLEALKDFDQTESVFGRRLSETLSRTRAPEVAVLK